VHINLNTTPPIEKFCKKISFGKKKKKGKKGKRPKKDRQTGPPEKGRSSSEENRIGNSLVPPPPGGKARGAQKKNKRGDAGGVKGQIRGTFPRNNSGKTCRSG